MLNWWTICRLSKLEHAKNLKNAEMLRISRQESADQNQSNPFIHVILDRLGKFLCNYYLVPNFAEFKIKAEFRSYPVSRNQYQACVHKPYLKNVLSSGVPPLPHPLSDVPRFRYDTNKPEHAAAFVFVLVQAAGRNIGVGSGLEGVVLAFDMQ